MKCKGGKCKLQPKGRIAKGDIEFEAFVHTFKDGTKLLFKPKKDPPQADKK